MKIKNRRKRRPNSKLTVKKTCYILRKNIQLISIIIVALSIIMPIACLSFFFEAMGANHELIQAIFDSGNGFLPTLFSLSFVMIIFILLLYLFPFFLGYVIQKKEKLKNIKPSNSYLKYIAIALPLTPLAYILGAYYFSISIPHTSLFILFFIVFVPIIQSTIIYFNMHKRSFFEVCVIWLFKEILSTGCFIIALVTYISLNISQISSTIISEMICISAGYAIFYNIYSHSYSAIQWLKINSMHDDKPPSLQPFPMVMFIITSLFIFAIIFSKMPYAKIFGISNFYNTFNTSSIKLSQSQLLDLGFIDLPNFKGPQYGSYQSLNKSWQIGNAYYRANLGTYKLITSSPCATMAIRFTANLEPDFVSLHQNTQACKNLITKLKKERKSKNRYSQSNALSELGILKTKSYGFPNEKSVILDGIKNLKTASALGNPAADFYLGFLSYQKQNLKQSVYRLKEAAEYSYQPAIEELLHLYQTQLLSPKKAYYWALRDLPFNQSAATTTISTYRPLLNQAEKKQVAKWLKKFQRK